MDHTAGIIISSLVAIALVLLLIRKVRLDNPYNKVLKAIFLIGLISFISSLFFQYLGHFTSILLAKLAYIFIGGGIIILMWEEFKGGYKEMGLWSS